MAKKWEYRVIGLPPPAGGSHMMEEFLNEYGREGWELVQLVNPMPDLTRPGLVYFKRPKAS